MEENKNDLPLILVFYLDRELLSNKEIVKAFSDNLNEIFDSKGANIISLFMPADGAEKVECINPIMVSEEKYDEINNLVSQIKSNFGL